jgi:hypothetical protein
MGIAIDKLEDCYEKEEGEEGLKIEGRPAG